MGDRVLYQVHSPSCNEEGAVVYAHWGGEYATGVVRRLRQRMQGRGSDVPYWTARLVQEVLADSDFAEGNISVGVMLPLDSDGQGRQRSHGDAGVVRINCDDGTVECYGGYLDAASFRPAV